MNKTPRVERDGNVVDLFTGQPYSAAAQQRFIRIAPENDNLCIVFSNRQQSDRLFSLKIACWGLRACGEVVGLVPWLDHLVPCNELDDPLHGTWEGYYDPRTESIFETPPEHKVIELESAAEYFGDSEQDDEVVQELPDTIGTHAMLASPESVELALVAVFSWRLMGSGEVLPMLIDEDQVDSTPVLPGDDCLYSAYSDPDFRYFFQHHIANQIKAEDPAALAAIALLFEPS